jgi:uncharacterized membrane protein
MPEFFPRRTIIWRLERTNPFRTLTVSVAEIGLLTGIVLRLIRALTLPRAPESTAWVYYVFAVLLLCGATVLHLSNYTVRHWLWRAPAFAASTAAGEALTSLVLIAFHREPFGTGRASFIDWPQMAVNSLAITSAIVCAFAALLALVVQIVRYVLLLSEHRAHTVGAIHAERARDEERG